MKVESPTEAQVLQVRLMSFEKFNANWYMQNLRYVPRDERRLVGNYQVSRYVRRTSTTAAVRCKPSMTAVSHV